METDLVLLLANGTSIRSAAHVAGISRRSLTRWLADGLRELIASGALEDFMSDQTPLDRELAALTTQSEVDADLARLRAELGTGSSQKELGRGEGCQNSDSTFERGFGVLCDGLLRPQRWVRERVCFCRMLGRGSRASFRLRRRRANRAQARRATRGRRLERPPSVSARSLPELAILRAHARLGDVAAQHGLAVRARAGVGGINPLRTRAGQVASGTRY
jgi:hypothetical protein